MHLVEILLPLNDNSGCPSPLKNMPPSGRLTGRKLFVPDAHVATDVIVLGRGAAGPTAILLPMDRAGIGAHPLDSMAGDKLFELELADVAIRPDDLIGPPGGGWALLGPAFRVGALARCAEMTGAAQRVLELCVEHARVRVQGGRPIGGGWRRPTRPPSRRPAAGRLEEGISAVRLDISRFRGR